jgi:hypothetical protein
MTDGKVGRDGCYLPKKKSASEMSAPEAEVGQDYGDILGFPGDGFKDKDYANPAEALLRPGNRLWMVVTQT